MLREEYEALQDGNIVFRHYTKPYSGGVCQGFDMFEVVRKIHDGYFFANKVKMGLLYNSGEIYKFHYSEVELNTTEVLYDFSRKKLYRELTLLDQGENPKLENKKNKPKAIFRIKPLNVRDLFIEFKGEKRKQGVISYNKLPREIQELDLDTHVFDRVYIRRDGFLAWYIPHQGEYAIAPDILYDLL